MRRICKLFLLLLCICGAASTPAAATIKLRMATLAPPGSSWLKALRKIAREIKEQTKGEVEIKVYPSGRKGGEATVVQKMRNGTLDAGVLTAEGLAKIHKSLLVFQLPRLFRDSAELEYVRRQLAPEIEATLLKKGFRLLSWGDAGTNYIISSKVVASSAQLKGLNLLTTGDPITRQVASLAGANPTLIKHGEIANAIKGGLLHALVTSPLIAVGLQWYIELKFINSLPWSMGIGATVISKASWDKLTPDQQKIVVAVHRKWQQTLTRKVHRDNAKSRVLLTQNGLKAIAPQDVVAWDKLATAVQEALVGKLYPRSLLDRVRKLIAARRSGK